MKEEQKNILILMTSMLAVGLIGFVVYQKKRKQNIGLMKETEELEDNSKVVKSSYTPIAPQGIATKQSELDKRSKNTALYLKYIPKQVLIETKTNTTIRDRNKFFDEWAAEEGGIESIQEMYKKNPTKFFASDIQYLKSKKILV